MTKTPIVIITRDNPEFLYLTLKSLTASETFNNPIIILDNSSELKITKNFYFTSNEIAVNFDDWTSEGKSSQEIYDKMYAETFLSIPQITKIKGIGKKFQVVSTPYVISPNKILFYAMKMVFNLFPEANSCCILDDSLLFNKHWLKKTLDIYNDERFHTKVGIISVYSEIDTEPSYKYRFNDDIYRGKMLFINKNLYKEMGYLGWFKDDVKLPADEPNYIVLERIGESLGYITITSEESYIQFIGKRNLAGKNKLLKYQHNFRRPVVWNKNFLD